MSMWLYDDAQEELEFQYLRTEIKRLEKEYLDLRIQLRDAEAELRADPDSEYSKAKVVYLKKRVINLEKMAPRFADDHPLEISLFGPPHG